MDNENQVLEPQVETETTPEVVVEPQVDSSALLEQLEKEKEARRQLTARAAKAEAERKAALEQLEKARDGGPVPLAVEDYIDISTALDGLDPREKARLAEEHKYTGKSLMELRESEDFQLWQSAYRSKQEAENALKPSTTQAVEDGPKSLTQRLAEATLAEKEAILAEAGLWKSPRPKADRSDIGTKHSLRPY